MSRPVERHRRESKREQLDEMLREFAQECPLTNWAQYVEDLHVPADIAPALITQRAELLRLAKPRPLTEDECAKLYGVLAGLIQTNIVLQRHAQNVATLVENWSNMFGGLASVGRQIEHFAKFQPSTTEVEEFEKGPWT